MGPEGVEDPVVREACRRLARELSPRQIWLFGSRARGRAAPDSDLDLLVVAESEEPVAKRMARAYRALYGLPAAVDVIVVTPAEVEEFRTWRSHIVARALAEGKLLHGDVAG